MEQLLEFAAENRWLVSAALVIGTMLVYNELRLARVARFAVSPAQAVQLMNSGALVLDIRDEKAYNEGHLKGAKRVDLASLADQLKDFERYKSKRVVAYDERGTLAARAVAALRRNAFEHAYLLRGGLAAWREENMPVDQGKQPDKAKKAKRA